MDVQPIRYVANELHPLPSPLKELQPARRKEVQGLADRQSALIIDYGSENIKAGYDASEGPEIVFRPQISKNRDSSKADLPIKGFVNTSYEQVDLTRNNYKSPYERNLVLHFSLLQQCNDYLLGELVKPNRRLRSPVIVSQPFANPVHCRNALLEQFFECYEVDSVLVGVDALFAYFYQVDCNLGRYESETALVVSMGATAIHVVAVVGGRVDYSSVRRLNLGGNNAFQLFGRSLLLKNPQLKDRLTYTMLRDLYQRFTRVAIDYRLQLQHFQSKFKSPPNPHLYRNRVQQANKALGDEKLAFCEGVEVDFDSLIEVPEQEVRRKEEVRKRMSQKLKETLARRKDMKKKMYQAELQSCLDLKQRYEEHDKFAHEQVAELFGDHHPHDKLAKKIHSLQVKLGLAEEKPEENKFSLINVPDHELPPEKLKYKKLQLYQKQALEAKKQKQAERQLQEARMRDLRENNPQLYLTQLKQKYRAAANRIKENERIRSELSNRKSKLKQRKMQAIARIAEQDYDPDQQQPAEDDWLAYRDGEDSDHYSELEAMEAELREIDPEWTQAKDHHHLKETNQLFLLTDLVKPHQIYFQPLMIGNNQLDLIQIIVAILAPYSASTVNALLSNVILVGGGSVVPGLKERLERDLVRECPVGSPIRVKVGKGGANGAFLGMQHIGRFERDLIYRMSYKREEYLSNGAFVANHWSNPQPK